MPDILSSDEIHKNMSQLQSDWRIAGRSLVRQFELTDFRAALDMVNKIGEIAEAANHHPDLELGWGRVSVSLTTHSVNGLTMDDFDLARQIDALNG